MRGTIHDVAKSRAVPRRGKLLATGDSLLAEASPYDAVWGIGLTAEEARQTPPDKWPGQNLLGTLLMEVRAELKRA